VDNGSRLDATWSVDGSLWVFDDGDIMPCQFEAFAPIFLSRRRKDDQLTFLRLAAD
jgi:hypothetical protein